MHSWDMRMRRCLSRRVDEGCFSSTALAASADSSLYATGSKAGVVNIYRYPQRSASHSLPGSPVSIFSVVLSTCGMSGHVSYH